MLLAILENTFLGHKYIYTAVQLVFFRFKNVKANMSKHVLVNVQGPPFGNTVIFVEPWV